jgi:DNA-binding transcriptional MerR regulator
MKGIEIAKKLNISTSALRHYEAWGLVPKVERSANGYRRYTNEHEAYFHCIRALLPGFGMALIRSIMPLIIRGDKLDALWQINKAQVNLHAEKETVQRAIEMINFIETAELPNYLSKSAFTIGEAAELANVSSSSIRHWEKEGLIKPERHKESGFRVYSRTDIRKVLIIRTVQRVAYSLDIVREVLAGMDNNNVSQAKEIALQSLQFLDHALSQQVRGIAYLYKLFDCLSNREGAREKTFL